MNISIIGSGYVGLVTGVCLAHLGHRVICVDNDTQKIKELKQGQSPIFEPGLEPLLKRYLKEKKLLFTTSIEEATRQSLVIFIAVGTPSKENGEADLTYVENVARQIALHMDSYKLIVEKSTVPTATGQRIERTIRMTLSQRFSEDPSSRGRARWRNSSKKNSSKGEVPPFDVASNPEFLREGSAISDLMEPDRIVLGVESKKAEELLREIYKPWKAPVVVTNMNSAEMIKHASNSFLATKISFINAVAQICDRVGADVLKVAEGMGFDKRIGRGFLDAGVGYGGSCFPKDVDAFIRLAEKNGYDFALLKEVRTINESQKSSFVRLIEDKLWIVKNKQIGILGLAFKPNTDDMRLAPSLDIVVALKKEGAIIKAYDPQANGKAKDVLPPIQFCKDAYTAAAGCDCLVFLTEWEEFKSLDFAKIRRRMHQPLIFDGRNFLDQDRLERLGFEYFGIGRGKV